jgi:hypothetical protein
MAIPKRYARRIEVDGVRYLWRVRPRTYNAATCEEHYATIFWNVDPSFSFAVQSEGSPGRVLVVLLPNEYVCWTSSTSVKPAVVAHCIRGALARGWRPSDRGGPFTFRPTTRREMIPGLREAIDAS